MAPFSFGSGKPDPFKKRQQELEELKERLAREREELQRELEAADEPPEPEEPEETGPPVWRAGEEEWETISDRTSVSRRELRDKRIRDRNQFVVLILVLLIVLTLIFYVLWPVATTAN